MAKLKAPFALDRSLNTTEQTSRNIADVLAEELSAIITALGGLNFINYEVVEELPTTGISTTTIYLVPSDDPQSGNTYDEYINLNGTVSGWEKIGSTAIDLSGYYTSAETDALLDEKLDKDSFDEQTATDEFSTINGGLLSECKVSLTPNQDLHGYDSPWVGGAGKNKLPLVLADIKSLNTTGTWSGNEYTDKGVTFTINTDSSGNIISVNANGTASGNAILKVVNSVSLNENYIVSGSPSGGSYNSSYSIWAISQSPYNEAIDSGNGVTITSNYSREIRVRIANGYTANNLLFYPMIRLATESDPTFEPYTNICPITGHTEVDVDVSDGQTTQEQVTVNLGGTYYSGTLDVVSGELTVDSAFIASYNGEALPSTWISDRDVYAVGTTPTTGAEVCYKLATPQTIQLSPTTVKALVGENHLDAPLEGQEISEVKYKKMFTFDDVIAYIQSLS